MSRTDLVARARLRARQIVERRQQVIVERVVLRRTGGLVAQGPFNGLAVSQSKGWSWFVCYLVGSYESELAPVLERLIARRPSVVADIGCADGFYAVGMARRLPDAQVFAFDIDDRAQAETRSVAVRNAVDDRVTVDGFCSPERLDELCADGALVIADCEGAEVELLDLERAPHLAAATVLVELHDFVDPTIQRTITDRFQATHQIEIIESQPRRKADWPVLRGLPARLAAMAVDERRPTTPHPMRWALLEPMERGAS